VVQSGFADTVWVVNAADLQVIAGIEVGSGAYGIAVNPVTNRIYVTNSNDGTVSVIDGASNTVIATVFLGSTSPWGVGVDPVRNIAYVSQSVDFGVAVIDGATNAPIGSIYVDGNNTDAQPNPATGRVYVPVNGTGQTRVLRFQ
jgi:YVTN family beta-propeller protein